MGMISILCNLLVLVAGQWSPQQVNRGRMAQIPLCIVIHTQWHAFILLNGSPLSQCSPFTGSFGEGSEQLRSSFPRPGQQWSPHTPPPIGFRGCCTTLPLG
eukprot:EG_transcript_38354